MSTTTDSLFKDLQDAIGQEDFDKVQELCDKLWVKYPGDVDVAKVRAVAFLQQGDFEKALTFIKSCNASLQDLLKEEKAYCLYRTRNYDEVISILSRTPDNPFKDNLLAQTYYRLGKYQEAFLIFRKLCEQRPDDLELKTNLLATLASSASSPEVSEAFRGVRSANAEAIESNYELSYNVACALLRLGSVKEAESALKHALDVCQQQNSSEDSFLEESSAIRAQLAYTLQISDPSASEEPTSTYLSILSNKSADKSVVAVASNNLVVLQKEQKLFGAEKKLTTALEVAQEGRLTQEQKSVLTFNKAILLLKMNRLEQVQELLASFRAEFPESHLPTLVASALLFREKKELEAISLLKDNLHSFREGLVPFLLILAHLSSDKKEKLGYLMAAPADFKFRAGTTAATISLLEQIGDPAAATQHLDQAIAFWKKSKGAQELEIYKQLLLANASLKMDSQQFEDAALIFKELQRIDGERGKEYLCKEILAYARFDPSKAADLSRQLPEISISSSSSSSIDVEALENLSLSRPSKPVEVKVEVTTSAQDNAQKKAKNKKKKNKKNKKKRLPKKYDPNSLPDPERWLPLRSRSTFKNRGKKASTRSHQGAVSTGQEKIAPTGTSHKQSSSSFSSSSRSRGARRGRR